MRLVKTGQRFTGGSKVPRKQAPVKVTKADGTVTWIKDTRTYAQRRDASNYSRRRVTHKLKQQVYERDGGKCRLCGTDKGPFQVDHIRPYSKGGWNVLTNLQLLCAPCNQKKGAIWERKTAER